VQASPETPCDFGAEFLDDLPYDPEVLMFDRLLEVDRDRSLVRCRMVTELPLPLTSSQRTHPVRHPQHLAGGLIIHATGSLGFVHAYYVLGLRHRDGWIGYGTHIHKASFRRLITPGEEVEGTCQAIRLDLGENRHFIRYRLELRSDGKRCYRGEHSGLWTRVDGSA
jgi:3-hydroxymyristoyl/3-hydroxydecanoyl-(acyl carrier protein) dehydratase